MNTVIGSVWWAHNIVGKEMKGREGKAGSGGVDDGSAPPEGSQPFNSQSRIESVSESVPPRAWMLVVYQARGDTLSKRQAGRQAMHLHVHSHRCVVASRYIHIGIQRV